MRELTVESVGALSIHHRRDGSERPWWIDLHLNEEPLYCIGGSCGTCEAVFKRIVDLKVPIAPSALSEVLNLGIDEVNEDIVSTVMPLLPKGKYWVSLLDVVPTQTTHGTNYGVGCEADYFWWRSFERGERHHAYELILPFEAPTNLDRNRIKHYQRELKRKRHPTALAFSIEDERAWSAAYYETALAHFLLDGHHKVMAASKAKMPIRILSFLLVQYACDGDDTMRTYYATGRYPGVSEVLRQKRREVHRDTRY